MANPVVNNPDYIPVGPIRRRMKECGHTVKDLAIWTGINGSTLRAIVYSEAKYIHRDNAEKLCREIGIDPIDMGL